MAVSPSSGRCPVSHCGVEPGPYTRQRPGPVICQYVHILRRGIFDTFSGEHKNIIIVRIGAGLIGHPL